MKRDLRALLDDARRRGWSVDRTRSDHWRLRHPSGAIVDSGSTPSCPRAVRNAAAAIRRVERSSMQATTTPFDQP